MDLGSQDRHREGVAQALAESDAVEVPVADLGEELATLRLLPPGDADMAASLRRFGQLSPLVVYRQGARLEVIDGFRRLRAAGRQGSPSSLRVRPLAVDAPGALGALFALHRGCSGLSELEEGWVVQALVRRHGMAQAQVAQLLRRHQSWVSRRLLLVESLVDEVQRDVRLGLLGATAAREVARMPRGIQHAVAAGLARHGLTSRQAAQVCAAIERLGVADLAEVERLCATATLGPARAVTATEADRVHADLALLERLAHRLRSRLPGRSPTAALRGWLTTARPALVALLDAMTVTLEEP
jgi:ParB-like chromosome segregation protein Spo0J